MRCAVATAAFGAADVVEQQRELVAAEAGDDIARAHARAQPVGDVEEQPVAGVVTEAVVHHLEPVDVDEEHGDGAPGERGTFDGRFQPREEARPVRQAGERVVVGAVRELGLDALAFRDVAHVADHAVDAGIVEAVRHSHFEPPERPVRVAETDLHPGRGALFTRGDRPEERPRPIEIGLVDEVGGQSGDRVGVVAEGPTDRGAHVAHRTFEVDHHDDVRAVLHERAEPLLAAAHRLLDAFLLGGRPAEQRDDHRGAARFQHRQTVSLRLRQERRHRADPDEDLADGDRHDREDSRGTRRRATRPVECSRPLRTPSPARASHPNPSRRS